MPTHLKWAKINKMKIMKCLKNLFRRIKNNIFYLKISQLRMYDKFLYIYPNYFTTHSTFLSRDHLCSCDMHH